jgi:hypothetical protein
MFVEQKTKQSIILEKKIQAYTMSHRQYEEDVAPFTHLAYSDDDLRLLIYRKASQIAQKKEIETLIGFEKEIFESEKEIEQW